MRANPFVAEMKCDFIDSVAHFGPRKSLVGIVTEPSGLATAAKPAVVILNTGTIHRVGYHRMYVSMSRRLAEAGHAVLRFDFSGIGDSAAHSAGQPLLQSNLADIRSALEWVEVTLHVSQVILIGLCSGADHAILYGYSDPRVVGVVLIDPYIPTTARYFVKYIHRRLLDVSLKSFSFRKSKLVRRMFENISLRLYRESQSQHPALEKAGAQTHLERVYRATVQARVHLLVICSDYAPRQVYREQFIDAFSSVRFGDLLKLEFLKGSDHTFSSKEYRDDLNETIELWGRATKFGRADHAVRLTPQQNLLDVVK
jgi:dienelactone hydrolase